MRNWQKLLLAALAVVSLGILPALAAGFFTQNLPPVFPAGTTGNQNNLNGVSIGTGYTTLPLVGTELIPADTNLSAGLNPQSEAISVDQLRTYVQTPSALTSAATLAYSLLSSSLFTLTMSANQTLGTPSNLMPGKQWQLRFTQDSVGSRVLTTASVPIYKWFNLVSTSFAGTSTVLPVLTTTAAASDIVSCTYDGLFAYCGVLRDGISNAGRPSSP